jgi:hypothetical protein
MNAFIRGFLALTTTLGVILVSQAAIAEEWNLEEKPWEKFGFATVGVFLAGRWTAVSASAAASAWTSTWRRRWAWNRPTRSFAPMRLVALHQQTGATGWI